ncbi:hypothetical protein Pelo_7723 [Pelomyxa schiedti]|nr:hypothetical protein Pelo_7723 [Pelomyxa schiedti]
MNSGPVYSGHTSSTSLELDQLTVSTSSSTSTISFQPLSANANHMSPLPYSTPQYELSYVPPPLPLKAGHPTSSDTPSLTSSTISLPFDSNTEVNVGSLNSLAPRHCSITSPVAISNDDYGLDALPSNLADVLSCSSFVPQKQPLVATNSDIGGQDTSPKELNLTFTTSSKFPQQSSSPHQNGGHEPVAEGVDDKQIEEGEVEGSFEACREGRPEVVVRCLLSTPNCVVCYNQKGNEGVFRVYEGKPPSLLGFYRLMGITQCIELRPGAFSINPRSFLSTETAIAQKFPEVPRLNLVPEPDLIPRSTAALDLQTSETIDLVCGVVDKVSGNTYCVVFENKVQRKMFFKSAVLELLLHQPGEQTRGLQKGQVILVKYAQIGKHEKYKEPGTLCYVPPNVAPETRRELQKATQVSSQFKIVHQLSTRGNRKRSATGQRCNQSS